MELKSLANPFPYASPSPICRRPPDPKKKIRPARRSRAPYLKSTCALSRRRAVSDMAVVGAVALSTPTPALAEQPDVTRYRKVGSGVILEGIGSGRRDIHVSRGFELCF
ncbi:Peptidyl-prolyl cis-trans isomerase [Zea mays]|uniref:Peptidyl-prolyl cis-trans isomerase n=1 Tax=Zea mays TaxID=4577 RepID=A0A1D6QR83_MAIZE|nr:Peptidyl-prolyl cis-trans isomerase [Zea mays]